MKKLSRKRLKSPQKKVYKLVTLIGCPYCKNVKKLIKDKGHSFKVIEEMDMSDTKNKNKWNEFVKKTYNKDHTTFPKIFLGNKFVGGYDNLKNAI